ncbi:hypothetical protein D3C59_13505 [Streptomyces sp. SHP22-7]|nr:hypothetical protein D3C59_13505 [Streptomyces sp. SHP22-7]
MVAQDAETRLDWEPDVLSPTAPLGHPDPHERGAERAASTKVDATSRPDVWWTNTRGAVLADGVWIGVALFGAVVNLTGKQVPQLTVDRRRALALDMEFVMQRLREEIPALMREGPAPFPTAGCQSSSGTIRGWRTR